MSTPTDVVGPPPPTGPSPAGPGRRPRGGWALVVADPEDRGARQVVDAGSAMVGRTLVAPAALARGTWHHRVGPDGRLGTTIALEDGRVLDDRVLTVVLCRADLAPARTDGVPSDFAGLERRAVLVSWLRGLGDRVVNRLHGTGTTGPAWSTPRWLVEAARAGLPVDWTGRPGDADPRPVTEAVVVGDLVLGAPWPAFAAGCRRLATAAGCRVLGVALAGAGRDAVVCGASTVPGLRGRGEAQAVAGLLSRLGLEPPSSPVLVEEQVGC